MAVSPNVQRGGLRISLNRGKQKLVRKGTKLVIDGSQGEELFTKGGLSKILGTKIAADLDYKIVTLGDTIVGVLQNIDHPSMTGLARANWQISRVRSARSVGHTAKLIYPDEVRKQNEAGWLRQANLGFVNGFRSLGKVHKTPADYEVGLTDFRKFSSADGDYGFIITNNVPWIHKMIYGSLTQPPSSFVDEAIAYAISVAKDA